MPKPRYVRVYRPVDATDVVRVRSALHGTHTRFYIENENYLHAHGQIRSLDSEVWLMVDERDTETAKDFLWLRLGLEPADLPMIRQPHSGLGLDRDYATALLRLFAVVVVVAMTVFFGVACPGLVGPPG